MTKFHIGLAAGWVTLSLTTLGQAQTDGGSEEDIKHCRTIVEASARLSCYDRIEELAVATHSDPRKPDVSNEGLGSDGAVASEPPDSDSDSAARISSDVAVDETASSVLTDDIGLSKPADAYKPIPVTISRCGQASNRKWYFYFDNGQVWQYLGARALKYRKCETRGTLIEDGMGFSLKLDEDNAKLRVKRVR